MHFLFSIDDEKEKTQSIGFSAITVAIQSKLYPSNNKETVFVSKDRLRYNRPTMRASGQIEEGKKLLYEEVAARIEVMIEKGLIDREIEFRRLGI